MGKTEPQTNDLGPNKRHHRIASSNQPLSQQQITSLQQQNQPSPICQITAQEICGEDIPIPAEFSRSHISQLPEFSQLSHRPHQS